MADAMPCLTEFDTKQKRLGALLAAHGLEALLIQRVSSFAWATCGAASYVNTAATDGASALLVTPSGRYVIADNIEATRLKQEEQLESQGWEFRVAPWYEANAAIADLTRGLKLGADGPYPGAVDLSQAFTRLRASLTPEEGDRFRALCTLSAAAMDIAARTVRPGMTEHEIAGLLAREAQSRGVQPIVNLVATDARVYAFRHPLPTDRRMERYAMLILCGRKWGLVCSVTRLVHFGRLPDDLRRKAEAVARVDAAFIAATRPGEKLGEVFRAATEVYRELGYGDEWHLHHQGGPAGYEPREFVATATTEDCVSPGQAYAWNPSIAGTKSEDTILVGATDNQILTAMPDWPTLPIVVDGQTLNRPAILEVI
jgi:Xaa-Pro aminopeptidase